MEGLSHVLTELRLESFYLDADGHTDIPFFVFCLVLVSALLGDALAVGYFSARGDIAPIWMLKILRTGTSVVTTVLYIPLLAVFVTMLRCGPHSNSAVCFSAAHLALAIPIGVLCLIFAALSLAVAGTFYNDNATVGELEARSFARPDAAYLTVTTLLTTSFVLLHGTHSEGALWYLAVICLVGNVWQGV